MNYICFATDKSLGDVFIGFTINVAIPYLKAGEYNSKTVQGYLKHEQ